MVATRPHFALRLCVCTVLEVFEIVFEREDAIVPARDPCDLLLASNTIQFILIYYNILFYSVPTDKTLRLSYFGSSLRQRGVTAAHFELTQLQFHDPAASPCEKLDKEGAQKVLGALLEQRSSYFPTRLSHSSTSMEKIIIVNL